MESVMHVLCIYFIALGIIIFNKYLSLQAKFNAFILLSVCSTMVYFHYLLNDDNNTHNDSLYIPKRLRSKEWLGMKRSIKSLLNNMWLKLMTHAESINTKCRPINRQYKLNLKRIPNKNRIAIVALTVMAMQAKHSYYEVK